MKIKKYTLYIIFLLILLGLFSPISQVDASPYSDCVAFENTLGEPDPGSCAGLQGGPRGSPVASSCSGVKGIGNIICKIHQILNSIIPVLVALGVVYFVWGVVQYMIGGEEEAKKKGKDRIVYGLIGFAVIIGLWGIVNILVKTFDLGGYSVDATALTDTLYEDIGPGCDLGSKPKVQNVLNYATCIIGKSVIPLIFALATMMFVWGVVQFVINSDDEAKKSKGKQFMLWGIIALTVMVSVWGLVGILSSTFGVGTGFIPQVSPTTSVKP
jgi:hypothetical protein